ncbi:MAG: hypothetical protein A2Z20_10670 [Bdellovibrionales bacterium RBG_16_40_8]|nr:MAG: hypothetical protein A2Z20_10670 [Bdellovibrionales bacterium RBG_16_40_8]
MKNKRLFILFLALWSVELLGSPLPKPVTDFLRLEQEHLNTSRDLTRIIRPINTQDINYRPESAQIFTVKTYWIDSDLLYTFQDAESLPISSTELVRTVKGHKQVLFMVHPESETFYAELLRNADIGPEYEGTPTASARTLLVWKKDNPELFFFAKLSLNKEIGGVIRTISESEVPRSVGTSMALNGGRKTLSKNFAYLREFWGVMPRGFNRGGMILREVPKELITGKLKLTPVFALYTSTQDTSAPMLAMIKRSGLDSMQFILEKFLRPFAVHFLNMTIKQGISMEPHGQNLLVELNDNGDLTNTFYHRDFGGFNIDFEYRSDLGLDFLSNLPVINSMTKDYLILQHEQSLNNSLFTYFVGNILYAMADSLKTEDGKKIFEYSHLQKVFLQELNQEAINEYGFEIQKLSDIARPIKQARRRFIGSTRNRCNRLLEAN